MNDAARGAALAVAVIAVGLLLGFAAFWFIGWSATDVGR